MGSLTVQIMPVNNVKQDKALAETLAHQDKAIEFLKTVNGVEAVTPLKDQQLKRLIQPWLGDGVNIDNLPMPRIIDVKLRKDANIDFNDLSVKLMQATPMASIDNHKLWLSKLINFADGLKMLAMSILVLVIMITSGAIFYTTQTSLGLHRYTIEILHQMGAKDTYMAQQYSKRMAILGVTGGIIGVVFAIPTIFIIASMSKQIEGGIISEATLSIPAWLTIMSLPLFSLTIAMFTAYYTVKRTLQKMI